jgi:hypothetical protein
MLSILIAASEAVLNGTRWKPNAILRRERRFPITDAWVRSADGKMTRTQSSADQRGVPVIELYRRSSYWVPLDVGPMVGTRIRSWREAGTLTTDSTEKDYDVGVPWPGPPRPEPRKVASPNVKTPPS